MSQPRDKPPLALLLTAAKRRAGANWLTIEHDLDIRRATREQWMNGNTTRLPLVEVLRLCDYLGVTPEECANAVLRNVLPSWVTKEHATAQGETLSQRGRRGGTREPRTPRRRNRSDRDPA